LIKCENGQSVSDDKDSHADVLSISCKHLETTNLLPWDLTAELDIALAEEPKISAGPNFGSTPAKRLRNQHA
jgi:hypothetical protein